MTSPTNQAIQDAVDAGYLYQGHKPVFYSTTGHWCIYDGDGDFDAIPLSDFFMDAEWWRCLGKARGWSCPLKHAHGYKYDCSVWIKKWKRFIDALSEGKSPEDFFSTLV